MKKILNIVIKDIKNEFRTKELFSSMLTFALLIIVVFNFSFSFSGELLSHAIPSFLWITFTFAGILGLSRSFSNEKENEAIKGVLMSPTDRSLIYIAKFISNTLFLLILAFLLVPMFILFFSFEIKGSLFHLLIVILAGTAGFVSVGTLFATMSINTRLREVMLPILLFPIILPLLINLVKVTEVVLSGKSFENIGYSIKLIIAFDIIFFTISALIYQYVLEED